MSVAVLAHGLLGDAVLSSLEFLLELLDAALDLEGVAHLLLLLLCNLDLLRQGLKLLLFFSDKLLGLIVLLFDRGQLG